MKKLIAAASFLILAAAANARNTAPKNTPINTISESNRTGSGQNTLADYTAYSGSKEATIITAPDHTHFSWLNLKSKHDNNLVTSESEDKAFQDPVVQQEPQKKVEVAVQEVNPQEVKSIPKARRVEKPAKVESSAKRPTARSARQTTAAGKPDRGGNPNVSGKPARAARPTGAGRPAGAGRPGNGKGKN